MGGHKIDLFDGLRTGPSHAGEIRILMLEDVADDAELTERELLRGGLRVQVKHVMTREDFEWEMREFRPDLVLADYALPAYDGLSALAFVLDRYPTVPFIFVSGTMGEEFAVEGLKRGATDYILKNNLTRLAPAVQRALAEAETRRERNKAEAALKEAEARYVALFERSLLFVFIHDFRGNFLDANNAALAILGYDRNEIKLLNLSDILDEAHLPLAFRTIDEIRCDGCQKCPVEFKLRKKNGDSVWVESEASLIYWDGKPYAIQGIARDITERKSLEEELRKSALTDALTGLYNRTGFFSLAAQQMKVASRSRTLLHLVFVDIDNLKEINDRQGHLEGDKMLRETARFLKTTFREADIVARIGGDEFVILTIADEGADRETVTARLAVNLEAYNAAGRAVRLSFSMGVACFHPDFPCTIDELIIQADKAMYGHKREKRETRQPGVKACRNEAEL